MLVYFTEANKRHIVKKKFSQNTNYYLEFKLPTLILDFSTLLLQKLTLEFLTLKLEEPDSS